VFNLKRSFNPMLIKGRMNLLLLLTNNLNQLLTFCCFSCKLKLCFSFFIFVFVSTKLITTDGRVEIEDVIGNINQPFKKMTNNLSVYLFLPFAFLSFYLSSILSFFFGPISLFTIKEDNCILSQNIFNLK